MEDHDAIGSDTSEYQQATKTLDDPVCWTEFISADVREKLVTNKFRSGRMDEYPADVSGRKCSNVHLNVSCQTEKLLIDTGLCIHLSLIVCFVSVANSSVTTVPDR